MLVCSLRKRKVDLCHYRQHFHLKSLDDLAVAKPIGLPIGEHLRSCCHWSQCQCCHLLNIAAW